MKTICIGIALLFVMTIASAATGNSSVDSQVKTSSPQTSQTAEAKIATPSTANSGHSAAVLSHSEADAMSLRGDSLMAQSEVNDIKVGSLGNDDLIYILVVILLVVVIVAVVR